MRMDAPFWRSLRVAAAAGLALCMIAACKPAAKPAAPAKPMTAGTNNVASGANDALMEHVSVFEQLMPPKGRDPFFPNSHRRNPAAIAKTTPGERPPPASELTLKGIVGSRNHRLAIINNAILEAGETGAVQVPGGHIKVKCLRIGEDYAVIEADGETQPKRLELNKKGL